MISDEQSNKFYYWLSGHYWNQLSINYRNLKKKNHVENKWNITHVWPFKR